jgi:hypothetical protein
MTHAEFFPQWLFLVGRDLLALSIAAAIAYFVVILLYSLAIKYK